MTPAPGPGTIRGLRQLLSPSGHVCVVAVDQRQALRKMLLERDVEPTPSALRSFKVEVARALADVTPALLVDPEYGLPAIVADVQTPARLPLVVAVERSGTVPYKGGQRSVPLDGWDAGAARCAGAAAAKLLVYVRADHEGTLESALDLCETVRAACRSVDLPFVLELVPFRCDDEDDGTYARSFGRHVLAAAEVGAALRPDLLKLPWPAPIGEEQPEAGALDALAALDVPWVLLSAGASFETFLGRVRRASIEGGARGSIAGRALWQDAVGAADVATTLRMGARERLLRLLDMLGGCGNALPVPALDDEPDWFSCRGGAADQLASAHLAAFD